MKLKDKVVAVTGASNGVGAAVAQRMAEQGARLVALDVDDEKGKELIGSLGSGHIFKHLDVSDASAWAAVLDEIVEEAGRLDILHLNAGVMLRPNGVPTLDDPFGWLNEESYRRIMGVNVDGVVFGLMEAVRRMEAQGGGSIVVTSSLAGVTPLPIDPIYSLTKHALVGLVRSADMALGGKGIRLNAVLPGGTDTAIVPPDLKSMMNKWQPPSFIAEVVASIVESEESGQLWLALSPDEGGVTKYEFAEVDITGLI